MARTLFTVIFTVFALAGAGLILYFVGNTLPDVQQSNITIDDTDRGIFRTPDPCENGTPAESCVDGVENRPWYCTRASELVERCDYCGCPPEEASEESLLCFDDGRCGMLPEPSEPLDENGTEPEENETEPEENETFPPPDPTPITPPENISYTETMTFAPTFSLDGWDDVLFLLRDFTPGSSWSDLDYCLLHCRRTGTGDEDFDCIDRGLGFLPSTAPNCSSDGVSMGVDLTDTLSLHPEWGVYMILSKNENADGEKEARGWLMRLNIDEGLMGQKEIFGDFPPVAFFKYDSDRDPDLPFFNRKFTIDTSRSYDPDGEIVQYSYTMQMVRAPASTTVRMFCVTDGAGGFDCSGVDLSDVVEMDGTNIVYPDGIPRDSASEWILKLEVLDDTALPIDMQGSTFYQPNSSKSEQIYKINLDTHTFTDQKHTTYGLPK